MGVKTKTKLIECHHTLAGLREATVLPPDAKGRKRYDVVILTEGKGNPRDKHLYSQACIDDPITAAAFEGKPCFLNHPSLIEDQSQPERRIQDRAGWFSEVHADGPALKAILTQSVSEAGDMLEAFIQDCLDFSLEFPGEDYGGISINANGESSPVEMGEETWNQVDRITEAESADAVTKAARGGRFEKKLEALRKAKETDVEADEKLKQLGEVLKSMRDKIETGEGFPLQNELRRQVNNALTLAGCGEPEGEAMITEAQYATMKKTVEAYEKAKTKNKESAADDKAASFAHTHATLKGLAGQVEDPGTKELLMNHAAKYAPKGEGTEGEGGGEQTPPEDNTESEAKEKAEMEAKKKKEAEEKEKKESEKTKEEKDKGAMESLRRENFELKRSQRLAESGLPEHLFKVVEVMSNGKTLEELDAIIEAQNEAYEHTLRESGIPAKTQIGSGKSSGTPALAGMSDFN